MKENELVVRKIIFNDLYEFLKIIQDVKIDLEVKTEGHNKFAVGIEFIKSLIANFYTAKEKTNIFLGSLVGLSGEDFGNLALKDSAKVLMAFIEVAKDANFFELFSSIFPQKK